MPPAVMDWTAFFDVFGPYILAIIGGVTTVIVAHLTATAINVRSTAKTTAKSQELAFDSNQKSQQLLFTLMEDVRGEVKDLRADQRESDRREMELRGDLAIIKGERDDQTRQLTQTQKTLAELQVQIQDLINERDTLLALLDRERIERAAAELARTTSETERTIERAKLQRQVDDLQAEVNDLKGRLNIKPTLDNPPPHADNNSSNSNAA